MGMKKFLIKLFLILLPFLIALTIYVIDDPNAQFLVQGGAAALTQADVGSYIQLAVGSGSTATGLSGTLIWAVES